MNGVVGFFPSVYVQELPSSIREEHPSRKLCDRDLYGLYLPPPADLWLSNDQKLGSYNLSEFQCVKFAPVPSQEEAKSAPHPGLSPVRSTLPTMSSKGSKIGQVHKEIDTAVRLFTGLGNMEFKVFIKDMNHTFSIEADHATLAKELMEIVTRNLGQSSLIGMQIVHVSIAMKVLSALSTHFTHLF